MDVVITDLDGTLLEHSTYGFSEARVSSVALYLEGRIGEMME